MSTPSPSPSPPPPESPSHSPPSNPRTLTTTKKPHPVPWSHQETVHLIEAYQEKWYSLKRGQLKANQWEEVAVTVAARCGYDDDYNRPEKSVVQCRHKMEKLRQRFREEKRRMSFTGACFWPYYDLMESLERGPMPISARPFVLTPPEDEINEEAEEEMEMEMEMGEEMEEEVKEYEYRNKSRSINYIIRKPTVVNRFAGGAAPVKRKREEMAEEEEMEVRIAGEIRAFTERIVGMERKKMEVMKETEKWKMEMENKRIEMILDSQRKIVGMISAAFNSQDELKMNMDQQF